MDHHHPPDGAEAALCWSPSDESTSPEEQRVFHWDPEFFHPRGRAGVNAQSVNEYRAGSPPVYGVNGRTIVYIMPLGPCWSHSFAMSEMQAASAPRNRNAKRAKEDHGVVPPQLDIIRRYLATFFYGIPVVLLDPVAIPVRKSKSHPENHGAEVRSRINENNPTQRKTQRYAPDIMEWMKLKTPSDTWCVIGLTHYDLYGDASANHCLGASSSPGIAVITFARMDPAFYGNSRPAYAKRLIKGSDMVEDASTAGANPTGSAGLASAAGKSEHWYLWMLKRVCRLAAHEMLHSLGLQHCSIFNCLLNADGVGDLDDASKSLLCPICLKKFQVVANIDVLKRYQSIAGFCSDFSYVFGAEGMWVCGRHEWVAHGLSRVRLPMFTPDDGVKADVTDADANLWSKHTVRQNTPTQAITATVPQLRPAPPATKQRRSSSGSREPSEAVQSRHAIWSLECSYG